MEGANRARRETAIVLCDGTAMSQKGRGKREELDELSTSHIDVRRSKVDREMSPFHISSVR